MKKTSLLLFILLFSMGLNAQFAGFGGKKGPKVKGKITGQLIDSLTNESISYATIVLKKAGKTKEINGMLSDDSGKFKLSDIQNGKYDLYISFLGFEDKKYESVELTLKKPDVDLGKILMIPTDYLLDEVEIKDKRALFENKVDKIVFNAEDDSSIAGGDATEVLRKVPTLSVDLDGNVSLRGSQNVRILINGKPSGMFSSNVADALKMFPADQIKKVEVITSPGAKYDGEGSAGIINIITKKENIEGLAGSINATAGNRQSNTFINLNAGKGRFGFSSNGAVFYSLPNDAEVSFTRTNLEDTYTYYSYDGLTETSRLGFNGSASAFYDFNAFNAINTSISYRGFGFDTDGTTNGSLEGLDFTRLTVGDNLFSGYDWNTDYTKKFENNEKQEFSVAVQVSGNIQDQNNMVDETGEFLQTGEVYERTEDIINDADNLEITGQIDYVHPVGKSNKLEVGAKSVIRHIDSYSEFKSASTISNLFLYDQDVYAGYLSYNFYWKKLNFVTGLRYEKTEIAGDGDESTQIFSNSYDNFLPNFAVAKSFKNFRNLKFAYSKRIQRPSLYFINSFRNSTDFGNIVQGNPYLDPELTNQYEISYNTNFKGITIFSSLYYKKSTEIIEQVTLLEDNGVSYTTFSNVGENNSIGINMFLSKSIGKVTIRGGGDVYTYNATGFINGMEVSNEALSYRIFTNGEFSFTSTLKADFFGFFQAPRFTLQGENASFSIYGIGFRKDFKNSSLGIRIIEPFVNNKNFDSDITGTDFRQVSRFSIPFRSFGINFRYKFGKVDFKERKSKIRNSDLKQGEGGGGNQGGQQGGGGMGGS
ncbi:MAG: TonB-dependent receptor [Bacteroidia bacterium]|nr:TonB-dependent receptor [Bacteroidia bacterium]MBT8229900.1 TonB-dependent receptor [Bacteroidia bacterium]